MGLIERHPVPPSTSLPALRQLSNLTKADIAQALRNLHELYCPLPGLLDFQTQSSGGAAAVDSGYASEDDREEAADCAETLRSDVIERNFTERWLTTFIGRAGETSLDDQTCQRFVDSACFVLSCITRNYDVDQTDDPDLGMRREFEFALGGDAGATIRVALHDTPMQMGDDYTDVGLQTWGGSVVLSDIICRSPGRFKMDSSTLSSTSRVVELGSGTGLVSLVLSILLPRIVDACPSVIATDFHPTVLNNLKANIASHMVSQTDAAPLQACHLDWAAPTRSPPLDVLADILVAADAVYATEHAVLLRDCAGRLLAPDGVFWLMVSVRSNGKFESISSSVEAAFADKDKCPTAEDGRLLTILGMEDVNRKRGVGRADEIGYKLFKISWA